MTSKLIHKDPPHSSILPQASPMHPDERFRRFGPIQPMEAPYRRTLWDKLLGRI